MTTSYGIAQVAHIDDSAGIVELSFYETQNLTEPLAKSHFGANTPRIVGQREAFQDLYPEGSFGSKNMPLSKLLRVGDQFVAEVSRGLVLKRAQYIFPHGHTGPSRAQNVGIVTNVNLRVVIVALSGVWADISRDALPADARGLEPGDRILANQILESRPLKIASVKVLARGFKFGIDQKALATPSFIQSVPPMENYHRSTAQNGPVNRSYHQGSAEYFRQGTRPQGPVSIGIIGKLDNWSGVIWNGTWGLIEFKPTSCRAVLAGSKTGFLLEHFECGQVVYFQATGHHNPGFFHNFATFVGPVESDKSHCPCIDGVHLALARGTVTELSGKVGTMSIPGYGVAKFDRLVWLDTTQAYSAAENEPKMGQTQRVLIAQVPKTRGNRVLAFLDWQREEETAFRRKHALPAGLKVLSEIPNEVSGIAYVGLLAKSQAVLYDPHLGRIHASLADVSIQGRKEGDHQGLLPHYFASGDFVRFYAEEVEKGHLGCKYVATWLGLPNQEREPGDLSNWGQVSDIFMVSGTVCAVTSSFGLLKTASGAVFGFNRTSCPFYIEHVYDQFQVGQKNLEAIIIREPFFLPKIDDADMVPKPDYRVLCFPSLQEQFEWEIGGKNCARLMRKSPDPTKGRDDLEIGFGKLQISTEDLAGSSPRRAESGASGDAGSVVEMAEKPGKVGAVGDKKEKRFAAEFPFSLPEPRQKRGSVDLLLNLCDVADKDDLLLSFDANPLEGRGKGSPESGIESARCATEECDTHHMGPGVKPTEPPLTKTEKLARFVRQLLRDEEAATMILNRFPYEMNDIMPELSK